MTQTAQRRQAVIAPSREVPPSKLLDRVRAAIRARHYSLRTEEAYVGWKSARLKNVLRAKNGTLIFLGSPKSFISLHYVVPCCEGFAEDTLCLQVSRSHLCRNLN